MADEKDLIRYTIILFMMKVSPKKKIEGIICTSYDGPIGILWIYILRPAVYISSSAKCSSAFVFKCLMKYAFLSYEINCGNNMSMVLHFWHNTAGKFSKYIFLAESDVSTYSTYSCGQKGLTVHRTIVVKLKWGDQVCSLLEYLGKMFQSLNIAKYMFKFCIY